MAIDMAIAVAIIVAVKSGQIPNLPTCGIHSVVVIDSRMFIPTKAFLTKGVGRHKEKLTSFEMALRDAHLANFNLVRVSSIFPPHCELVDREEGLSMLKPGQVLFTVVTRTEKYESKAFVDTVVFRGSDVAAANLCDALQRFSVSAAALAIVPLVGAWMALGAWLGREQAARAQSADSNRNAAVEQTSSRSPVI